MTIESSLFTAISADSNAGPLVSNSDSPETFRIYPVVAPLETARPFIVYTLVFGERHETFSGIATLKNSLVQVDVYDTTYPRTLADYIYTAVDTNLSVGRSDDQALFEPDTELHRILMRFSLWL